MVEFGATAFKMVLWIKTVVESTFAVSGANGPKMAAFTRIGERRIPQSGIPADWHCPAGTDRWRYTLESH